MKRFVVVFAVLSAVTSLAVVSWAQGRQLPSAHFSVVFRVTSENVSLACDTGCSWTTLQFPASRMPVTVDRQGVVPDLSDRTPGDSTFVIRISTARDNLRVSCQRGCRWTSLLFAPKSEVAQFDENGFVRAAHRKAVALEALERGATRNAVQFPTRWKWAGTGSTMRVNIIDGERVAAENVVPRLTHEQRLEGVESVSLIRMGTIYAGASRSVDSCSSSTNGDELRNFCTLESSIEITTLTPTRVEGQIESDIGFDCRTCKVIRTGKMKPFVWTAVK